ncbi:MAG TPA: hypothetical protein PLS24_00715 [Sedimentisphaerales bacterium]|nr:hypothetical protein [Sedimentisphaerales bacterium]
MRSTTCPLGAGSKSSKRNGRGIVLVLANTEPVKNFKIVKNFKNFSV